jgi:hypothetical protein
VSAGGAEWPKALAGRRETLLVPAGAAQMDPS